MGFLPVILMGAYHCRGLGLARVRFRIVDNTVVLSIVSVKYTVPV